VLSHRPTQRTSQRERPSTTNPMVRTAGDRTTVGNPPACYEPVPGSMLVPRVRQLRDVTTVMRPRMRACSTGVFGSCLLPCAPNELRPSATAERIIVPKILKANMRAGCGESERRKGACRLACRSNVVPATEVARRLLPCREAQQQNQWTASRTNRRSRDYGRPGVKLRPFIEGYRCSHSFRARQPAELAYARCYAG
jgi:hypothetical protein